MANFNRGNHRGGYAGVGRGGGNASSGCGGNGDGDGQQPRKNLPDVKGRFDRYCVWCGEVIPDLGLERHLRCLNNRCYRGVPINGWRRRRDGLQRCSRCYSISHRSFMFCELCRRPRTENDAFALQINMEGVDPYVIDLPVVGPAAAPARAAPPAAPVPAAPVPAAPVAPMAPAGEVVVVAPAAAQARAPTPVPVWEDDDEVFMNLQ